MRLRIGVLCASLNLYLNVKIFDAEILSRDS